MSSSTLAPSDLFDASARPGDPATESLAAATGLRIGYLPATAEPACDAEQALHAAGCSAIRRESARDGRVLAALVAFLDRGDLLAAPDIGCLPGGYGLKRLLDDLDACGATAVFLAEELSTAGEAGRLLRNAVRAASELQPAAGLARPTAAMRDRARAMAAAGIRPSRIVRALGISRMTLWRWLKEDAARADAGAAPTLLEL